MARRFVGPVPGRRGEAAAGVAPRGAAHTARRMRGLERAGAAWRGVARRRTLQPVTQPCTLKVCSSMGIVTDGCRRRTISTRRWRSSPLWGRPRGACVGRGCGVWREVGRCCAARGRPGTRASRGGALRSRAAVRRPRCARRGAARGQPGQQPPPRAISTGLLLNQATRRQACAPLQHRGSPWRGGRETAARAPPAGACAFHGVMLHCTTATLRVRTTRSSSWRRVTER